MSGVAIGTDDTLPSSPAHRGRVRVILNPGAGNRGLPTSTPTAADLEAILAHVGVAADVVETDSEDEGRAATGEAVRAGYEVVVAAGGDGTIGMVATELLGTATALGILPMGSIMNIPRSLGIPRDLAGAAAIVATGIVVPMDLGEVRGRPFFEAGSVGMNAAMFREAQRFQGGDRRSLLRTLWVAFRYRPARMRIELDDRILRTRALTVTVSNGPYTGAGMTVAPDARLDDGRFDVRVFERFSKWELVRHLASIAFGRRQYVPQVSTYRSRYARISSAHPLPARADSRDLGATPVEFRVRPSALRVVVPPDGLPDEVVVRCAALAVAGGRAVVGWDGRGLRRVGRDPLIVGPDAAWNRLRLALGLSPDVGARLVGVGERVFGRVVRAARTFGHRSSPLRLSSGRS